jgi:hypothetical protein
MLPETGIVHWRHRKPENAHNCRSVHAALYSAASTIQGSAVVKINATEKILKTAVQQGFAEIFTRAIPFFSQSSAALNENMHKNCVLAHITKACDT